MLTGDAPAAVLHQQPQGNALNLIQDVRTMLDVFAEAGLLEMSYGDGYGARIKLNKTKAKVDIEATPTFIRLREISEE